MVTEKTKIISEEVLENYKKFSPSKLPLEDQKFYDHQINKRQSLFVDRLKLPLQIFKGAELLDLGCGTGEQDISYASWGSKLTLVDMNSISTNQVKEYLEKFDLEDQLTSIETKSLFDFKPQQEFDICISEGVLHHTDDPERGFDILVSNLKEGGFVVLQLAFDTSHMQRSLHRFILDFLTDSSEEMIVEVSKVLFDETLQRASRLGGRSIDQIVYDFYTNPKHKGINVSDILDWYKKHNIRYYSSYPNIEPEGLVDGIHKDTFSKTVMDNDFMVEFVDFLFMIASQDDSVFYSKMEDELKSIKNNKDSFFNSSFLRDYEYGDKKEIKLEEVNNSFKDYVGSVLSFFDKRNTYVKDQITCFLNEFVELIDAMEKNDIQSVKEKIDSFDVLFKGYNGVPSNYIVGYKLNEE